MDARVITPARAAMPAVASAASGSTLISWHRWGGLIATAVLLVAALTALPLVYKKQLIRWLVVPEQTLPADYDVARAGAELDRLAARVPDIETYLIKVPNPEEPYWMLTGADNHLHAYAVETIVPVGEGHWLLDALVVIRELHVELMAGLFGEYLLLLGGLVAVALGVTGLILWWPSRRGLRMRWILPAPRQFKVQFLMQYHRHSGALTSLIVVLVSLTGVLLLWQSLVFPLLPPQPFATQPQPMANMASAPPSVLLAHAAEAFPDGWPTYIRLDAKDGAQPSIRFRLPGEWHPNGRTSVIFDMARGEVRVSERSDQATTSRKLVNQAYPLHAGYGMNGLYLFLVFISALAMVWLTVTGLVSYLRRLGLRRR